MVLLGVMAEQKRSRNSNSNAEAAAFDTRLTSMAQSSVIIGTVAVADRVGLFNSWLNTAAPRTVNANATPNTHCALQLDTHCLLSPCLPHDRSTACMIGGYTSEGCRHHEQARVHSVLQARFSPRVATAPPTRTHSPILHTHTQNCCALFFYRSFCGLVVCCLFSVCNKPLTYYPISRPFTHTHTRL